MMQDSDRVLTRLAELGLTLPSPPGPVAMYQPAVVVGDHLFLSGQIPLRDGALLATGAVPSRVDPETATACARQCVLNALAAAKAELGSLERIARVVKLGVFVASDPGFGGQPQIANGASELLVEIFGDAGRHVRAAVGVSALPLDATVEIEFTMLVRG